MAKDIAPEVLTEDDVRKIIPALAAPKRTPIVRWLFKTLRIVDVNEVHARHIDKQGAAFARAILADPAINVKYRVHGEEHLVGMMDQGAFATVSNHPFGSVDGIILIDMIGSMRPDYGVLVNGFLGHIGALRGSFIPVSPPHKKKEGEESVASSAGGVREVLRRFSSGSPVGFFPAGGISVYKAGRNTVADTAWQDSCSKMITHTPVPVYPIFFGGQNSVFFHFLGWLNWMVRTPRIPAELFNKRGHTIDVYIGAPIPVEAIEQFKGRPRELSIYLYDRTYSLAPKKR